MRILFISIFAAFLVISCGNSNQQEKNNSKEASSPLASIQAISEKIAKDTANPALFYERAKFYHQIEGFDEAIVDFEKSLLLDSAQLPVYYDLSDCYMDYYKSRKAIRTLKRAKAIFPNDKTLIMKLSQLLLITKQYADAKKTLSIILDKDGQDPQALYLLGVCFKEEGKYDAAINSFQTAVESEPELIDAWVNLGLIYGDKADPSALDYYNNALRLDSNYVPAIHNKAFYLQNNSKIKEAIKLYDKINKIDPSYTPAFLNAGILHFELDSFKIAESYFDQALNLNPSFDLAHYYKGIISEAKGDFENAQKHLQTAVQINKNFERAKRALEEINNHLNK